MYYYLMDRKSPTWHVLLIEAIRFTDEQEAEMIKAVKTKNVQYVLMSNRYTSTEFGLGTFGVTHLTKLWNYIEDNYEVVETYGNWQAPPGWTTNHAIRIMKRVKE